ncbi:MAG: hypothetical protein HPY85_11435 [Anaerolineae bacterium]|nr:hypothetical protein [Anaerolineae bacterium]
MQRIVVIGTTGSGKSTFGRRLAATLGVPFVELDRFLWSPNWQKRDTAEYQRLLGEALAQDGWVMDGNTRENRDRVWGRADTVVWLNYPFLINFSRLFWRTVQRVIKHEEVFEGCVETFHSQFLSSDSLFIWFFRTFWKRRKMYRELFDHPPYPHLHMIEFTKPRKANRFIQLATQKESQP